MDNNLLTLFCLVDGESTSNAFPIEIAPAKTISDLKDLIKAEKALRFNDVAANKLALWRVSLFDNDDNDLPILLDTVSEKKKLKPTDDISDVFPEAPRKKTIHIIVQRLLQAPNTLPSPAKRDLEGDEGLSSARKRYRTHTLIEAIEVAGLTQKVVADGRYKISRLDKKERVLLLGVIGQMVGRTDIFYPLSSTARKLQGTSMKDMDRISAPHGPNPNLPVVGTSDLYVRKAYNDLHDTIVGKFERAGNGVERHIVVTGTSGIGKSAFLVYFAIRLLAESDDDNPPIIIFHKESGDCYAFGGPYTVRSGSLEDFEPFLNLPDTWYFVDSSPFPILGQAKTVISASPKTLFSDSRDFKNVEKEVHWFYYMAPWHLEELEKCWNSVTDFKVVPWDTVEELYSKIGGVPRYVLQTPMKVLDLHPSGLDNAKITACKRLERALKIVEDPMMLMRNFAEAKESLGFSCRLIHRWPTNGHRKYRLEWASTYVAEKIADSMTQDSCTQMLKALIRDPSGSASGIMFEAYVLRAFREGGHTFEIRDLETGDLASLDIPPNPSITHFDKVPKVPAGILCIPKICNYACVDLLLAPRDLFQITVSSSHPIKGTPLSTLIGSLIEKAWIPSLGEPRLIFVVPGHVYTDFKKQDYLTSEGKVYENVPADILRVKQYVLKIDVEFAAYGKTPGLQVPLQ